MKKHISLLLAIACVLCLLGGCKSEDASDGQTAETTQASGVEETEPDQATCETQDTAAAESTETGETSAPAETTQPQEDSGIPYLQKVARADQPIFAGPGYDYAYVATVEIATAYTIVEEAWDGEGNLWGRLKSGIGWIDLTDVRAENAPSVTAGYADDTLLRSGDYVECIADETEYAVKLAFRPTEPVTNVSLTLLQFAGDTYEAAEALCFLEELLPDAPLVACVAFAGDMTVYGLSYTDSQGASHRYVISISGRNGSVVMEEIGT